jgi:uncharacterized protein (TIGR03032 family)
LIYSCTLGILAFVAFSSVVGEGRRYEFTRTLGRVATLSKKKDEEKAAEEQSAQEKDPQKRAKPAAKKADEKVPATAKDEPAKDPALEDQDAPGATDLDEPAGAGDGAGGDEQDGDQKKEGSETAEPDFRYVHSDNFPALLEALGGTLLITTYQAGKLVAFRANGGKISMLLRTFDKAMGLAVDPLRMAIATNHHVWFLRNSPEIGAKLEPKGTHDACYLPRMSYVSGSLDFHEVAWGGDELWIVNTLFSCICTLHPEHSFVPRWRPPFVTQLIRQDRCHVNGMCLVNGIPKYVTAFGETDSPEGWRPGKADGGVLMEVPSGEIVARGLSMPHSPRHHMDKLWVLDSGRGRLATVDLKNGQVETVTKFDGYTRGLAFAGPFAFVGLSKIRETAVFGGVPIAEEIEERKCGISVVDLRSGNVVAFIEFEGTVEEVFDVQILPRFRFPAIVGLQKKTIERACVIGPEVPIQSGKT